MKLLNVSLSVLMIPLLIFSSGGFNIFTHLCHETGHKIISWQGPQSCEHEHEGCERESDNHQHDFCCENSINSGRCCENIHEFIQTIETISIDDAIGVNYSPAETMVIADEFFDESQPLSPIYRSFDFSSPPRYSSKYIVVKYNNLKLDCCKS